MNALKRILIGTAAIVIWGNSAVAQPLDGWDDPYLQAAADLWLGGQDSRAAYAQIGELAHSGNIAARHLANQLSRVWVPMDFPDLTRDERRAPWPHSRAQPLLPNEPYPIDHDDYPNLSLPPLTDAATPQHWTAQADRLRAAGLRSTLLNDGYASLYDNYRHLSIEAARYLDPLVDASDNVQSTLWIMRGLETERLNFREQFDRDSTADDAARWGGPPWSDAAATDFTTALADQRVTAIRALGFLQSTEDNAATGMLPTTLGAVNADVAEFARLPY